MHSCAVDEDLQNAGTFKGFGNNVFGLEMAWSQLSELVILRNED